MSEKDKIEFLVKEVRLQKMKERKKEFNKARKERNKSNPSWRNG